VQRFAAVDVVRRVGLMAAVRWSLVSGLVGSVLDVVLLVFGKDLLGVGVGVAEDQRVVADLVS
jgi:uncharacterized membrane protein